MKGYIKASETCTKKTNIVDASVFRLNKTISEQFLVSKQIFNYRQRKWRHSNYKRAMYEQLFTERRNGFNIVWYVHNLRNGSPFFNKLLINTKNFSCRLYSSCKLFVCCFIIKRLNKTMPRQFYSSNKNSFTLQNNFKYYVILLFREFDENQKSFEISWLFQLVQQDAIKNIP